MCLIIYGSCRSDHFTMSHLRKTNQTLDSLQDTCINNHINWAKRLRGRYSAAISYTFDILFVCFDALCPSQQIFSHVEMGLPGLNQY